jgi:hypothetical protein
MTERQLLENDSDVVFGLLGDSMVRRVCFELSISPLTFNQLIEVTGFSQSAMSRTVARLRKEHVALPSSGRDKPIELFNPQLIREVFIAGIELHLVLLSAAIDESKKNLDRLKQITPVS